MQILIPMREPETRAELAYQLALEDVKLREAREMLDAIEKRRSEIMAKLREVGNHGRGC